MKPAPLLSEHPRWLQFALAILLPASGLPPVLVAITTALGAAFGALGGYLRVRVAG